MKAELIPTILYAEGRPRDVGTDRALANSLNVFVDRKSAHQSPWLTNEVFGQPYLMIPMFFGTEHLSATVDRLLTVAPFFRSNDGTSATVQITLTDTLPTYSSGTTWSSLATPRFVGKYSQTTQWTTTSTTWQTGAEKTISLSAKDIEWGFGFMLLVFTGACECRGLAKCVEGIRTVT